MQFGDLAIKLPAGQEPTEEDYKRAELALGEDLPRNPDTRSKVLRVAALGYAAERQQAAQPKPEASRDEVARINLAQEIERHHAICTHLLPGSIFSRVSLLDPAIRQTQAVRYLRDEFPKTSKRNVLLLGGTGSGKTFAGVGYLAMVSRIYETDPGRYKCNAAFVTAYKLQEMIVRRKWDDLDRLRLAKNLMLDDLGAEPAKQYGESTAVFFEQLFAERHQNNLRTIMTSNGTVESIRETYGDRFVSRFRESGEVFETSDQDWRRV